ncbi:conserved hypothetical protein [Pediculus humanus corporis]|uniref:CDAN1-interacting nuclease 1 n=1 Tax=Pediculus humanus subsp. corporis TaxID=121224 RepID=E0VSN2_PEDHC|nr:uncharacterized protein Phum_PHUM420760 [Pediculus humanus corporis]EEB16388.1 conserved hypothetical protein [Pediculus humanus corporis]
MILLQETYIKIISRIQNCKENYQKLELELSDEFGYLNMKSLNNSPDVILKLSNEMDMTCTQVAKIILDNYYEKDKNLISTNNKTSNLKQYMKDSTLIDDLDLAHEVFLCQLYDYQYGHINDIIRHCFGQEYEYHLQKIVKEKNLTFQSEDDLRMYGYDKTPDIKLDVPFAVDGFVINWIESKALFGDPEEHQNYLNEQYSSYWNRFGTGLVIYWLGLVDSIIDPGEKRFIVRDDFPKEITLINPFIIADIPENTSKNLVKDSGNSQCDNETNKENTMAEQ